MSTKFSSLADPKLVEVLRSGKVGVLPTDTIYGLVCKADDVQAVARLYDLKKREKKPGTVIASNIDQLVTLGVKKRYLKAVEQFWPNQISIQIPFQGTYLSQNVPHMAFRIVKDALLLNVLKQVGPLLTTSANKPGEQESSTISHAIEYFGESVDFYVDGGDLSNRKSSTIIRVVDDAVEVLRQGAVKIDEETGRIIK